ncbi:MULTISPECIES: chromate transporter [Oceanobacillus]|uniref:Transporter YwrA n=1 Tax=Oceanobacillus indicireducens TaxID=1004261 RepID=A0A918D3P3_9BACI|nr:MULTISPECIES: chromate transporter [Oceanobacillus]GGN62553.1 putative transporter YwrA [Oceanobacillus indicireducens]
MIYWEIFKANFIANILGYGGGPATIPLLEHEVVHKYEWFTVSEFSEMVALGNGLPGPIATKLSGYIGFEMGGVLGSFIGVFAAVAPSMILMIALLGLLLKFKDSPKVKRLTQYIRPTIAVLLGVMTFNFFMNAYETSGIYHTVIIAVLSFFALERFRISPVLVVLGALIYGAVLIG